MGGSTGVALVDGVLMPIEQAAIPVTDPGYALGATVFESTFADGRRDPGANLVRLRESAEATGIPMPDEGLLRAEIEQVRVAMGGRAVIRVDLTGGGRRMVFGTPVDPGRFHRAISAWRAPWVDQPLLPGFVKHRSRAPWWAEIRRRGVDELLFVDADGRFTEGSSCGVLAVIDGRLWTAPWDGRILRSTTVERLLGHAEALGIEVVRQGPPASGGWDALYVASTTRSLAPVASLDGEELPRWEPLGRALARADD
ncbi:MAG: aminotransferase class IV [Alphaproteobacteria bacterium]|nr:aminotransferase class IV [Alphaproteobacteria bacterium]MCB9697387.1 aminotransferase class IV [Alphaproteobacteria bacterium]